MGKVILYLDMPAPIRNYSPEQHDSKESLPLAIPKETVRNLVDELKNKNLDVEYCAVHRGWQFTLKGKLSNCEAHRLTIRNVGPDLFDTIRKAFKNNDISNGDYRMTEGAIGGVSAPLID